MDNATLARELRDLREQFDAGDLSERDYDHLRERLALRTAAAATATGTTGDASGMPATSRSRRSQFRMVAAMALSVVVVLAALLPAIRERGPDGGITGNDSIEIDPTQAGLERVAAAQRAWRAGRRTEAIRHYRQATAILPHEPQLRTEFGVALAETGRLKEAEEQLRAAIRMDAQLPLARVYLGGVLLRLGRGDAAAAQWRRYLELAPDGEPADAVRRRLRELRRRQRA